MHVSAMSMMQTGSKVAMRSVMVAFLLACLAGQTRTGRQPLTQSSLGCLRRPGSVSVTLRQAALWTPLCILRAFRPMLAGYAAVASTARSAGVATNARRLRQVHAAHACLYTHECHGQDIWQLPVSI